MVLLKLFLTFFKIGLFTFGGGYAMLPLIQDEVIENAWLQESQIIDFIAISESTPGPFAINIATFIGMELCGVLGAICATLGVVMPSLIIIIIIANFFEKFKSNKIVASCMKVLHATTIGLIAAAGISIAVTVFKDIFTNINLQGILFWQSKELIFSLVLFGIMSLLAMKKVHPIIIIILSALSGILLYFL